MFFQNTALKVAENNQKTELFGENIWQNRCYFQSWKHLPAVSTNDKLSSGLMLTFYPLACFYSFPKQALHDRLTKSVTANRSAFFYTKQMPSERALWKGHFIAWWEKQQRAFHMNRQLCVAYFEDGRSKLVSSGLHTASRRWAEITFLALMSCDEANEVNEKLFWFIFYIVLLLFIHF